MPGASERTFSGRALGSELTLFVRAGSRSVDLEPRGGSGVDRSAEEAAWDCVRAEFEAVDRALSRFRDDSELTTLNRLAGTGAVVDASWRLREAVAIMHRAGRMTGGRFDPTVLGVLEQLGERGATLGRVADRWSGPGAAIDGDGTRGDTDPLERPRPVRAPQRPLDSGGIGKGLALRWAARRALAQLPARSALMLDAGGDLVAAGDRADTAWSVGIQDPVAIGADEAGPIAVVELRGGAIATSSVGVRRWQAPDGTEVHHLIDPVTRAPARTGLIAVTVAIDDPAWAEVWTKALFLAGRERIRDEARELGLAAWWIDVDGRLGMTPAARAQTSWVDETRVR
jgi:thiamine biosynthesis lipoprotein